MVCFQLGLMASRSDCLWILFKNGAEEGGGKRSTRMPRRDPSLKTENEVSIRTEFSVASGDACNVPWLMAPWL